MSDTDSSPTHPLRHYEGLPRSVGDISQRLRNCLGTKNPALERRMRVTLANVIVGQMLPESAVKGGTAMKVRLGHDGSRFTPDLDTARKSTVQEFLAEFRANLEKGWTGFQGRVVERAAPKPAGVPKDYVMAPYDVKLTYNDKGWHTVVLELGHNEIGDADDPEYVLADDIVEWFVALGLPAPDPIAVMRADHQIAQKLHACSCPDSERAHDLVDLQLIMSAAPPDLAQVRETSVRLFTYRQGHSWPPTVVAGEEWATIYDEAADGLEVLPDVGAAVAWANDLVATIDAAG